MSNSSVRTRFAPSPTGFMHIGNVRTALYTYLLAKKHGGTFILRIEDTDTERYVPEAVELIYRTLKMAGMNYDEGPEVGGNFGPYIQSERTEIYAKHIAELLEKGAAYRCFCSKERLEELHETQQLSKQPTRYDGHCKKLSTSDIEQQLAKKIPFVVRQAIPADQTVTFHDEVFGDISVSSNELEDSVLLKSNGIPTYNFAHVVDDHLMEITHVTRGMEFLSSTPKYILLHEAFGWKPPLYIHLPPIMKSSTQKFSKRDGDASFFDLLERGFLKDAVINMIALLGWHPSNDREIYSLTELEQEFSIEGLHKSPAIFDLQKLLWLNKEYLKKMNLAQFEAAAKPFMQEIVFPSFVDSQKVFALIKDRIGMLSEIKEATDFFVALPDYSTDLFVHEKSKADLATTKTAFEWTSQHLMELTALNAETIKAFFERGKAETGLSTSQMLWAVRIALSGKKFTPGGAIEIVEILGIEESLRRLALAQQKIS